MKSRFDGLEIMGINVNVTSTDGSKTAVLDRMAIDRMQVKAGETVEVQAFARTTRERYSSKKFRSRSRKIRRPECSRSRSATEKRSRRILSIQYFVPRDLSELISTINKLKVSDRLYLQTFRTTNGAVIGSSEMPNLPPSVLATLNNDRTAGGIKPAVQTIVNEMKLPPAEFVISGQQTLTIEVVK